MSDECTDPELQTNTGRKIHKGEHQIPRKKFFRARAHSNPLNDQQFDAPTCPADVDWSLHYPAYKGQEPKPLPNFADVGCGFGGLLVRLSPLYPKDVIVGMELRDKVTHYVSDRIKALQRGNPGQYGNIAVVRTNSQKYLVNYFAKGQLTKLFFLFPDPHFKVTNHRRRIIQASLLAEYAYCLAPGGLLYTATDVPELAEWMKTRLDEHPLFSRVTPEELASDAAASVLTTATEEGQKVARNELETWVSIYRRVPHPDEVS